MPSNVNENIPNDGDLILGTPIRTNFATIKSEITALQGATVTWGTITGTLTLQTDLNTALTGKQATLVSGTTIRTVNGSTLLGVGDLAVAARGGDITGTATTTTVTAIQGRTIATSPAPADGDVLAWNAAQSCWEPRAVGPVTPTAPVVTPGAINGVVAIAITPYHIQATQSPTSYAITPALPANLSLNTATGEITGTPTAAQGATSYTMTATNAIGTSPGATLTITVAATLLAPVVTAGQSISATVGTAITPYQIQTTGGAPASYAVTPALPTGLSLNTTTGQITGTPGAGTSTGSPHTVTITATNATGTSPGVAMTVTIAAAAPSGWEVTNSLPSTVAVISMAASKTALGAVSSWTGWNPAFAADVTDDLYDAATPAAQTVRLFATFQGQSEVEIPFDNFSNPTVTGNAIRQWGYDSADNTIYLDGGQNGSGNPIQLRLVKA